VADHEKGADEKNILTAESTPSGFADQDTGAVGDAEQLTGNDGKRGADLFQMGLQKSG